MVKLLRLILFTGLGGAMVNVGCGEDLSANSGYADPCTTIMAGVLGCPAAKPVPPVFTVTDACNKLVECNILAGAFLGTIEGENCTDNNSCTVRPGGECLPYNETQRCYYPLLDYQWCNYRLSNPAVISDPCVREQHPDAKAIQRVIDCIAVTDCTALGLGFTDKRIKREDRAEKDKYNCSDGKTTIWTATICDAGLLAYDRLDPPH